MANWISLSKTDTGFVFATTHSIRGPRWPWISRVAAEEFGYPDDDFYCMEDDDGREFVAYCGEKLIEIHNERLTGCATGASPRREGLRAMYERVTRMAVSA